MNLTAIAIRRPVTISMFVVAVVLFGLVSLDRLALNLLPDISYPSLTVQTDYEDAAPAEIETLLTKPIEESVGVLPGLTRLSSISRPGQSEVVLEFSWDTNMDFASMDVREKIDLLELPEDAAKPVLLRFDPSNDPVLRLQLYGDVSLAQLRYIAEKEIQKGLESTEGVAAVKVIGGREEQIRIEIDEKRLAELGIPITEVTSVIQQANLNRASGSLYDLDSNYLVRTLNEFRSVDEIRNIIIRDQEGRKVILGDLAQVWRGTKDRNIVARYNGKESVELAIYKEGDANTVSVSEAARARLASMKTGRGFPSGVDYAVVFDQSEFIRQSVSNVLSAAVFGGLLATAVLFVFLRDPRSTLIIGVSIPISIMATFAMMYQTGITLNIMSLGGVALGVGMLVDNSIVVLEAVHRRRREGGPLAQAVYEGTREVGMAVTASTLTTIAVFLPLVFVEGIAGQLFKDQALTITYSVVASLLVAITFIPMLLGLQVKHPPRAASNGELPPEARIRWIAWIIRMARGAAHFLFVDMVRTVLMDIRRLLRLTGRLLLLPFNPLLTRFEDGYESLRRAYPIWLGRALDSKGLVFGFTFVLVVLAGLAYRQVGAELIPSLTQGEFSFEVRLPEGTRIEVTDNIVRQVEEKIRDYDGVGMVFSSVGGSNENQFARTTLEEHVGQLYVTMADRTGKAAEARVIDEIRDELARYPEVSYLLKRPTLFSFKTPIEVEIFAFDLATQQQLAEQVAGRMREIDGLTDIQTTTRLGNPEIQVRFDRQRLARLGLEEGRITDILRNKIRGDVASRYREDDKQIDILVRADENDRQTIENLRNLVINAPAAPGAATATGSSNQGNTNQRTNQTSQGQLSTATQTAAQRTTAGAETPATQSERAGQRTVPIPLASVADISVARGPAEIRRIRSQRAAIVSANLTGRDLRSVSDDIRAVLAELRADLPMSAVMQLGGQQEELENSYNSLFFALSLAIFLVYLVMASQFESLIHPFIILFSVPLALVGVALSLFLTGTTISVMVMLGVIILAGIVVNNAIVLVDYANQLRNQGRPKRQALLEASQVRLRPILMTTLTTVLGLIPMALGWGEGAEVRAPMAITVMGGLTFSTLLTLVFIPVLYELLDRRVLAADEVEAAAQPASGESSDAWPPAMGEGHTSVEGT